MTAHVLSDSWVAFQIIIPRNDVVGSPYDGGFKNDIVVRIPADGQMSLDGYERCAGCEQPEQFRYRIVPDLIFPLESRAAEHFAQFFEEGERRHDGEVALGPSCDEPCRYAGRVQ